MTTEREDLAAIIQRPETIDGGPVSCGPGAVFAGRTADAVLAAGWSRLVLDDAAVERAARALAGTLSVFKWEHIGPLTQEMYRDKARAVLAAAMESPDA